MVTATLFSDERVLEVPQFCPSVSKIHKNTLATALFLMLPQFGNDLSDGKIVPM